MAEYRSSNADPVEELRAASPHADKLHNHKPNDSALWFKNVPYVGPPVPVFTAPPVAAGVRCCVPPDADTPHDPYCPVHGYPPPQAGAVTRNLTEAARVAVGQSPVLPYGTPVPPNVGTSWEDLATWALAADQRIRATPDGYLWCRSWYVDEPGGPTLCLSPKTSRFQLQLENTNEDPPAAVRQLVVWLAVHWRCSNV